jgi:hypothetical protein
MGFIRYSKAKKKRREREKGGGEKGKKIRKSV